MHERHRLGSKLSKNDVKERQDEESDPECNGAMDAGRCRRLAEPSEDCVDEDRYRRLANPSQGERRERNTELGAGYVTVEVIERALNSARRTITCFDHLIDAASADRDESKLGRDEKRIEQDQKHNDTQAR
jgi:hypothetical protein